MRYMEYIYLTGAMMLIIFLATEFRNLSNQMTWALLASILLFSFMYSFRRTQRKKYDARIEEEMRKLEEQEKDEFFEESTNK